MSRIRADRVTNKEGTGAPLFPNGISVVGLTSLSNVVANSVSIGGTLTYEDVTNVDSVGVITARTGVRVTDGGVVVNAGVSTFAENINVLDNKRLTIGNGSDLSIHHTSGNSFIENGTGTLKIRGATIEFSNPSAAQMLQANSTAAVNLYFNGNKKFETSSSGVKVTGGYTENIVAVSGTAVDCSAGGYFTKTITGATTFTFTNVPIGVAYAFTFEVTLNGSNAITWPASVKWPADTAPAITDGKTQVFVFLTDDGGTRWRGSSLVDYTN